MGGYWWLAWRGGDGGGLMGGGKGVLLREEASGRLTLKDPRGSRLKSPMRVEAWWPGCLTQSSLT